MVLRGSGEIEHIAPPGAALGLLEVERFQELLEELEFSLGPNDVLILYTDGITEAQNQHKEDFGEERLQNVVRKNASLSARELYDTIISEVTTYSAGMPQSDDITLVVVRRNGT